MESKKSNTNESIYKRERDPETENKLMAKKSGRGSQRRKIRSMGVTHYLPGESQGRGSLAGCRLWGHTESDTTEAT